MLGLGSDRPKVNGERKILPLDAHGLKVMSIGFFVKEDEAVVWRGPMLHKALTQFLEDVAWGELDYLLIDLPPGTGDVSMTLAQLLPQAKFVIVTTPQAGGAEGRAPLGRDGRQGQARDRGRDREHVRLHHARRASASRSSARAAAAAWPTSSTSRCSARVPLTMALREQADAGTPLVFTDPDDPASQAIRQAARGLVALSPIELPVMQEPAPAAAPQPVGMSLPMA